MAPTATKQWKVVGKNGFESLKFEGNGSVAAVGDNEVLVKSMLPVPTFSRSKSRN